MFARDTYKLIWTDKEGSEHTERYCFSDECDWRLREVDYVEYHIYVITTYSMR